MLCGSLFHLSSYTDYSIVSYIYNDQFSYNESILWISDYNAQLCTLVSLQ